MSQAEATPLTLTKDGVSVTVYVYDERETWLKTLIKIAPPRTTANQSTNPADPNYVQYKMQLIDILSKTELRLTLKGYLDSDTDTAGDTAATKRQKLRKMFFSGGVMTITSFGDFTNITCNADQGEIARVNNDNERADGVAEFDFTITLVLGVTFGSGNTISI